MDIRSFIVIISIGLLPSLLFAQQETEGNYIYRSGDLIIISDVQRSEGIHYKVEVARLATINANDPELERLKRFGDLYTEILDNLDLTALLIGTFDQMEKARSVKKELESLGFTAAQVITYKNGLRSS